MRHLATATVLVVVLAQLGASGCRGQRDSGESSRAAEPASASAARGGPPVSRAPSASAATSPNELLSSLTPVVHPMRFEPSAGPSSRPTSIRVLGPRAFDAVKQTYVLLEIENDGAQPAIPDVVFKFADVRGNPIGSGKCSLAMVVVLPRERLPCTLLAPGATASASYEISTAPDFAAARAAKDLRLQFVVKDAKLGTFPEGAPSPFVRSVVTGTVANPTREPGTAAVEVVFYDEQRRIVSVGEHLADGPIRPGASAPFSALSSLYVTARSFSATAYAISTR